MTSARASSHATVSEPTTAQLPLSRATVDRAAERRHDEEWLTTAWADPSTRVLVIEEGRALVDAAGRLLFVSPEWAPDGERYFLGMEGDRPYFAVAGAAGTLERLEGQAPTDLVRAGQRQEIRAASLREIGGLLSDRDAGLMVHAVALQRWHANHGHCPRCGAVTVAEGAGHVRICLEDGSEHYPRVDPAVIMLVRDGHDRCLLARKPSWSEQRFSVLAGFVEPGESLEQAVVREVAEEVGLHVDTASYMASQPWPFPSSLMLGFVATTSGEAVAVDEDEIVEAGWYSRTELWDAAAREAVLLPPETSIARRLIEGWYGGALPAAW